MNNEISLMPTESEWNQIKEIAAQAVKSKLLPSAIDTPEKAAIIALKGRELGLPPMVAFSHINVIQGKPTMSAEIMLAYIYKNHPKAEIKFTKMTDEECVIEAKRPNESEFTTFRWDVKKATAMGLINKDNWVKQRGTMLRWRCITEMKRIKFPEVLMGIDYSPEEMQESVEKEPKKVANVVVIDSEVVDDFKEKLSQSTIKNEGFKNENIQIHSERIETAQRELSEFDNRTTVRNEIHQQDQRASVPQFDTQGVSSEYRITFGKDKGKTIEEIGIEVAKSRVEWLRNKEIETGKMMTADQIEFVKQVGLLS